MKSILRIHFLNINIQRKYILLLCDMHQKVKILWVFLTVIELLSKCNGEEFQNGSKAIEFAGNVGLNLFHVRSN